EHVAAGPQAWLTPCQCAPYHQNSALYPLIDVLERVVLRLERDETPPQKLSKLEGFVVQYGLPLAEAAPLFATILSLPLSVDYVPLAGVVRAAETADPAYSAHHSAAHRRPAARPLGHGRPALGRSDDAGVPTNHWLVRQLPYTRCRSRKLTHQLL